ncbi:MAG: hypothetical protein ACYC96_02730 [Fimbriimonadaceae bacterium]
MKSLNSFPLKGRAHQQGTLDAYRPHDVQQGDGFLVRLRKRRAEAIYNAHVGHLHLAGVDVIEKRLARQLSVFVTGCAVVLVATVAARCAGTAIGNPLDRVARAWLTPPATAASSPLPAVAVDFKDRFKKTDSSIDYAGLDRLIGRVITLGAKAVFVDYDFGVDPNGHKSSGSEIVTERTWHSPTPPVYLASFSAGLPKKYWLNSGNPEYAVHPFRVPNLPSNEIYQTGAIKVGDAPAMPGMMDTMAQLESQDPMSWQMQQIATDTVTGTIQPAFGEPAPVQASAYLLNPATLARVKSESIDYSQQDLANVPADMFKDRIVVIGSSTATPDVHGGSENPATKLVDLYSATAAAAAFSGERLHFLKPGFAIGLDIAAGLCVVLAVGWVLRTRIYDARQMPANRVALIVAILGAAAVTALGLVLARVLNVVWGDFLLVAGVAAVHPLLVRAKPEAVLKEVRRSSKATPQPAVAAVKPHVCTCGVCGSRLVEAPAMLAAPAAEVQPVKTQVLKKYPVKSRTASEPEVRTQPAVEQPRPMPPHKTHPVKSRPVTYRDSAMQHA